MSSTTRQKIAARQAEAQRAENRRRFLIAGGSTLVVLALVVGLVVAKLVSSPPKAGGAAALPAVAQQVTSVPAATFTAVGTASAVPLKATSGHPPVLTLHGKPEVLYMGGEYCPFCAAERWALAAALSRFGTFSGLHFIHSSPTDYAPNTPTLSFLGSHYSSRYVSFVPVEWYGEKVDLSTPFEHVYLQHPTAAEVALFGRYAGGAFPFVDIANQDVAPGAQYAPTALTGLTWAQVAADMHNPGSPVGRDIDGAANTITRAICSLTHDRPASVCRSV
jgi:hypothetical protein